MLPRLLEPEVMDTAEEAVDYNSMDHSQVNQVFVDGFVTALRLADEPHPDPWRIFDAGTGTALIPIEFMRRGIHAVVTASDLAEEMLVVARKNVAAAAMDASIELVLRDCKNLPEPNGTYDAVMSNSIIHHIPEPRRVLHELWRVLKPGGIFFVRDLLRPADTRTLDHLVNTYAADANDHQRQMFRDSLHAALTVAEVRELIQELGLVSVSVQATSDRHWTIQAKKL